ncbi:MULTISPECIES: dicarboxylate transporter/tellurite-resistance protein TehA [unclassified Caballeronia]|uniref:dicarboxylate transporter/tellurite-resistance protein TehA n=1 Tax=unclassified Caballeronia TaxID=2646786 RepID=UPI00285B344D|nr:MULTISPECIES: dicarboxylate transporter/tellurite-resistance protein TehA [unclassified Caballeronia]MDR5771536.1 dicarboxylate transporter/tellurite-resistance protein TehA [Caballeronia sp. LZ002]MDR5846972.1 dicarboxylate transporter/tellurite-resistance protein TehA [Caballeronia sp. LZ003]
MDTNDRMNKRQPMPVAFFGIAVGLLALAGAWRAAAHVWAIPAVVPPLLTASALSVWLALMIAYARKWLVERDAAIAEMAHPVQSSFAALAPVSTLLAAQAVQNYSRELAIALFVAGVVSQLGLGAYLHGRFWQGGRKPELTTPAIYLPTVAPSFVAGTAAASLGWTQIGALFFGAGVFSWLAIESIVMHRAAVHDPLPDALRPTLGIQLAPPVVGGVSYLAITHGVPDLFAYMLLGYGLYQAMMLTRLLPWIRQQSFTPSYWAFSFGVAALPTMAIRMLERGAAGPLLWLAPASFIVANVVFASLVVGTVLALFKGKLFPIVATHVKTV